MSAVETVANDAMLLRVNVIYSRSYDGALAAWHMA